MKFQNIDNFKNLSETDVEDLQKHVAKLVYMDEYDIYAKGFDNLVYGLEVLKTQGKSYSRQQAQIINDANKLLKDKANIEQVKVQIPLLSRIVDDSYYANATILNLEEIKAELEKVIERSAELNNSLSGIELLATKRKEK